MIRYTTLSPKQLPPLDYTKLLPLVVSHRRTIIVSLNAHLNHVTEKLSLK